MAMAMGAAFADERNEKIDVDMVERSDFGSDVCFDEKQTKRLLRKLDLALIPFLALLYL